MNTEHEIDEKIKQLQAQKEKLKKDKDGRQEKYNLLAQKFEENWAKYSPGLNELREKLENEYIAFQEKEKVLKNQIAKYCDDHEIVCPAIRTSDGNSRYVGFVLDAVKNEDMWDNALTDKIEEIMCGDNYNGPDPHIFSEYDGCGWASSNCY